MKKKAVRCFLLGLLIFGLGCAPKQLDSVNVFVTADIEGVFWSRPEPRYGNEVTGGLSILRSFLDKQAGPYLLLEGGNWFAQTPEGTLSQGNYFNHLTAGLPYTARLFTQQDLMYGWGSLSQILKTSPAPFVLSNVTMDNGQMPAGSKEWILKQVGDYKIGILGLVSPQAIKGQQRLSGLKINSPMEAAREGVAHLREKGARVVIVLSGLGAAAGTQGLTDEELAEEVEGIDIIISSGMSREEPHFDRVGKTWFVYPGSRFDSVGKVQLLFTKNGELADVKFEDVILYRRNFGEDAALVNEIEQIRQTTRKQMARTVGESARDLTGELNGESALGNWASDCLRSWAKTDAAVLNSSSLRAPLPAGTITQYDLYNLYPYTDNVTYLTIKGDALLNALEEGLCVSDNFAQISGLQVRYRPSAPSGKRIVSVQVKGAPLALWRTYRLAVTDYMLSGGAGHDGFIDSLEFKNTQVQMRTVLRLCLAGNKVVQAPQTGRWRVSK